MQIHKSILHSSFSCIPSHIGVFEFNDDRKTRRTQKPDRFLWPLVNWHETREMAFTVGLPIPNASTHMENLGCKGWPKPRSILLSPSCYLICWLTDVINGDIQLLFVDFPTSFFIWSVPYYPTSFLLAMSIESSQQVCVLIVSRVDRSLVAPFLFPCWSNQGSSQQVFIVSMSGGLYGR